MLSFLKFRDVNPGHRLDIAEDEFFQQFHPGHRPSGTQRYHTFCRKSEIISVNSSGAVLANPVPDSETEQPV